MSSFNIVKESKVIKSPRVMQMAGMFDVPIEEKSKIHLNGNLDIDDGLIVGASGCGKTTIARELFGDNVISGYQWDGNKSILDGFPQGMSIKEITGLLCSVGFGTSPNWVRPFHVLSNGEQFRVTIARALAEQSDLVVIDEFTSVIDRQVAKVASHTVQKAVKKTNKKLIAVSCHYDIVEWLQPDWIYQPESSHFERRCLRQRPTFDLKIYSIDKSTWNLFSKYHYLDPKLHVGAQCHGAFIDGQCVAFSAYIHYPNASYKNIKKGHRLVVHPDWQGLGIGGKVREWVGQYLYGKGFRFYVTTSHPALLHHYANSPRWKLINESCLRSKKSTLKAVKGSGKGGNKDLIKRQFEALTRGVKTYMYIPPHINQNKES
jgi:GNAT superfamily N-acetyltransferase